MRSIGLRCARWLAIGVFLVAGIAAAAPTGGAQTQQQTAWCQDNPVDARIVGCTAIIQSGRWSGKKLAVVFGNRGGAYYGKKDYDRAIANYDQAIRLDSKSAIAFCNRGVAYAAKKNYDRAIADCNEALRLGPDLAGVLGDRGLVHLMMGSFAQTLADYDAALRHAPGDAHYLYGRGLAKAGTGDTAGAEADKDAAKAAQADIAEVFARYGVE
jgi:tetratricopeptide (TPR) repeat protein